jgi:hypothetical protein
VVVVDELAPHATSCSSARAVYVGGVLLQSTPLRHSFPAAVPVRRRPAILPRDPLQEEKPSLLALRRPRSTRTFSAPAPALASAEELPGLSGAYGASMRQDGCSGLNSGRRMAIPS